MRKLTAKEQAFVLEYLVDLNATRACRAVYNTQNPNVLSAQVVAREPVREAIAAEMAKRRAERKIDADYVLDTIRETIERCKQAEPVRDSDGVPTGEYRFDASAVLKGSELLGKHLGMWLDKVQHQNPGGGPAAITVRLVKA